MIKLIVFAVITFTAVHSKPASTDLITFQDGKIGVNFAGYHAEAGLGGLLTGNAAHGGLSASAGTPFGQLAGAGLGGSLDGRTAGGAYAGASAGYGVGASAAIGGGLDEYGHQGGVGAESHAGGVSKKVVKLGESSPPGANVNKVTIIDEQPPAVDATYSGWTNVHSQNGAAGPTYYAEPQEITHIQKFKKRHRHLRPHKFLNIEKHVSIGSSVPQYQTQTFTQTDTNTQQQQQLEQQYQQQQYQQQQYQQQQYQQQHNQQDSYLPQASATAAAGHHFDFHKQAEFGLFSNHAAHFGGAHHSNGGGAVVVEQRPPTIQETIVEQPPKESSVRAAGGHHFDFHKQAEFGLFSNHAAHFGSGHHSKGGGSVVVEQQPPTIQETIVEQPPRVVYEKRVVPQVVYEKRIVPQVIVEKKVIPQPPIIHKTIQPPSPVISTSFNKEIYVDKKIESNVNVQKDITIGTDVSGGGYGGANYGGASYGGASYGGSNSYGSQGSYGVSGGYSHSHDRAKVIDNIFAIPIATLQAVNNLVSSTVSKTASSQGNINIHKSIEVNHG